MVTRKLSAPLMMPVSENTKTWAPLLLGKLNLTSEGGDILTLMPNKDRLKAAVLRDREEVRRHSAATMCEFGCGASTMKISALVRAH